MKRGLSICATIFLLFSIAWAQDISTRSDSPGGYWNYILKRIDEIEDMDLWGLVTTQLPEGVLSLKFKWTHKRADSRYNDEGKETPLLQTIEFDDPFGGDGRFLKLDFDAKGFGYGYTFMLSYGITDPLDVYIELPFQTEYLYMNPKFKAGSCANLGIRTLQDFYDFLEMLGRPRLVEKYESTGWETGDIHTGFSFNYYRSRYLSTAFTGRIFFPTGRLADPNESIYYGLGPQLDVGKGSYGIGTTHGLDFRPPWPLNRLTGAFEISWAYYFKGRRTAPKFMKPQIDLERTFGADPEILAYFPDLSDMSDHFYVTPGHQIDWNVNAGLNLTILGISVGYAYAWAQEPKIEAESEDFKRMLDAFEMFAETESKTLVLHASPNLLKAGIPVMLDFTLEYPLGGKNAIKFEDSYSAQVQLFYPF